MKASERQYRPIKHGDVIEGTVMKGQPRGNHD